MTESQTGRHPPGVIAGFRQLHTSTIANALDELRLDGVMLGLRQLVPGSKIVGPAVTVRETTGPFGTFTSADFRVGHMIDAARAGDVVVVANQGEPVSTWGGMASYAAKLKGVEGLVVDGGVRDLEEINEFAFPVFARHLVPTTGRLRLKIEAIGEPVELCGIAVRPGDLIVGDGTGVIRVPADRAVEVLDIARRGAADDAQAMGELERGLTFTEAMRRFQRI